MKRREIIVKKIVKYECEVCGHQYNDVRFALFCEAHRPPKPTLKQITVKTRYDGHLTAELS